MFYILNDRGEPERCSDVLQWAEWFERSADQRVVAQADVDGVLVSTVFLGVDHAIGGHPSLWETMVFGGRHDGRQWRYGALEEALVGHAWAVTFVSRGMAEATDE